MKVRAGVSPPFLVADPEAVEPGPWIDDDGAPLPGVLPEWDPATDLKVHRDIEIDTTSVKTQCQLEVGSELGLGMTWSSDARFRASVAGDDIELTGDRKLVRISAQIPGSQVAGNLSLKLFVWVVKANATSVLSPSNEGDLVWSDTKRFTLESDAPRFPTAVVDFGAMPAVADGAYWYLSWPSRDFREPFLASMRLLVNSGHQEVIDAIRTDSDLESSRAIRRHVFVDTARMLVEFGIQSEEFLEDHADYPEGSVGHAINELIRMCWGSTADPRKIRAERSEKPHVFEMRLQSRTMGVI